MMRRTVLVLMTITGMFLLSYCGNAGKRIISENRKENIKQLADGSLSLKINNADCYSDADNPSGNTAEWSVVLSKSGKYNVWLTSATKDTTDLRYRNSVLVSIANNSLEANPGCDKIIKNSSDVSYPYYRADSYLGSLYIPDTGVVYVQVVSEKILPKNYKPEEMSEENISKLISISLTPATR
jgi:hypothetical protein